MRGRFPQQAPYQFARSYARLGYRVLPLQPGEKRPHFKLAPRGLKDATRAPEVLHRWWGACPRCGVGILPPEGALVLDFDDPTAWEGLLGEYPELGEAPRQRTPRGGVHVFLKLPQGVRLSATTRRLPGVDLRGMGKAYVAAWPTKLSDGGVYVWERGLTPPEDLPRAPEGLLLRLLPPPPAPPREVVAVGASPSRLRALLEAYAHRVAQAPVGTRHNTLIRLARAAGGLLPHGLSPEEAAEVLVAAAMRGGLPEREARAAVRWGLVAGARVPLDLGGFSANPRFSAKPFAENFGPFSSQNSVFRKGAIYRMGLRKRRGVV